MKKNKSKNKKGILETIYDTIMKKGEPTRPISQSLVDLWEKPLEDEQKDKKHLLFLEKVGDKNSSEDEIEQNLIKVLKKNGWKIKGRREGNN